MPSRPDSARHPVEQSSPDTPERPFRLAGRGCSSKEDASSRGTESWPPASDSVSGPRRPGRHTQEGSCGRNKCTRECMIQLETFPELCPVSRDGNEAPGGWAHGELAPLTPNSLLLTTRKPSSPLATQSISVPTKGVERAGPCAHLPQDPSCVGRQEASGWSVPAPWPPPARSSPPSLPVSILPPAPR